MSQDKVAKFGPGQEFRLNKRVIFVEYESMTGELVKCWFHLSQITEMVLNDYKILSFDDLACLCSKDEEIFIKKVEYYEEECHLVIGDKLLIPTKVYFEDAGYQKAYETNNKLLRNVANSAYGIASRDWGDVLADSARYIHTQQSRCSGKTLWLSSATSFADEQPLWSISRYHDICERWLKEPPTPYEFIADDLEDCEKGVPNTKLIDPTALYFQYTTTGEMKPYEGVKNITPISTARYRGTVYTNPYSANGKAGHMLITPLSECTTINRDYLDAEIGDVVTINDDLNGDSWPSEHGKSFVWMGKAVGWKKLSDDNGYFDTDIASSLQEKLMKAVTNGADFDGDIVKRIKMFEEEIKMADKIRFDMYKPTIKKVIFSDPATIVFWTDNTKTIVRCGENDIYDPEKGVAMCCMKKLLGTNKTGSNYLDNNETLRGVKRHIQKWEEDNRKEAKSMEESIEKEFYTVTCNEEEN